MGLIEKEVKIRESIRRKTKGVIKDVREKEEVTFKEKGRKQNLVRGKKKTVRKVNSQTYRGRKQN